MAEIETKKSKATTKGREWWAKQIAECEKSGLTLVAYAKARHLNLNTLYNWKARLRGRRGANNKRKDSAPMQFVEVLNRRSVAVTTVEFESPHGWKVRMPVDMSKEAASRMLSLMEERI